jgi:hypothetical protein
VAKSKLAAVQAILEHGVCAACSDPLTARERRVNWVDATRDFTRQDRLLFCNSCYRSWMHSVNGYGLGDFYEWLEKRRNQA